MKQFAYNDGAAHRLEAARRHFHLLLILQPENRVGPYSKTGGYGTSGSSHCSHEELVANAIR